MHVLDLDVSEVIPVWRSRTAGSIYKVVRRAVQLH